MECTVPVEVRLATDHTDVGSLERVIGAALAEVGQALWAELVSRLEAAHPAPPACANCGGRPKANGRAGRRLVTLCGEIELRRRRYRCRGCGRETVPLDAALGLAPRTQHTLGVRERGLLLATEVSYAKTAEILDELRQISVSRTQLHAWVREEGARLEEAIAAEQAEMFERGATVDAERRPPTAWVSADGTFVNDRDTRTEFEVKVGLVFEGARQVGRSRRALVGRELSAGTEDWHTFAERLVRRCAVLGVFEAERLFFVSDGAEAIRWLREHYFPTAIELLDWHHLVAQLQAGLGQERAALLETALARAAEGDVDGLLGLLEKAARSAARADPGGTAGILAAAAYVAANRRGIENYRIVPFASSGPTEKGVDIVVARRFKRRGMSWTRRGASHLLRLRILRLNGSWDRYWRKRFAAELRPWPQAA
jgi:hypothetical protein